MGRYIWQTPQGHRAILIYFLVINLLGVFIMYLDKRKAKKGKWRISENTLFVYSLLGGSIGTLFGMYKFRHKTRKMKFKIGFPLILICHLLIIGYLLVKGVFWA